MKARRIIIAILISAGLAGGTAATVITMTAPATVSAATYHFE